MQHAADYTTTNHPYYHQPPPPQQASYLQTHNPSPNPNPNMNPNPIDHHHHPYASPSTYASAPPSSDYVPNYSSSYPPYSQNPDLSPTAPSYQQPQTPSYLQPQTSSFQQPQPSYSFPQFEAHGGAQSAPPPPNYYGPGPNYDQPPPNYGPGPNTNPSPVSPNSQYSSLHSQFSQSNPPVYENTYDESGYGSGPGSKLYGKMPTSGISYDEALYGSKSYGKMGNTGYNNNNGYGSDPGFVDGGYGSGYGSDGAFGNSDGVYAYKGSSKAEPYGARGTTPKSSTWSGFDDFGRPIGGFGSTEKDKGRSGGSGLKVVKAVPKVDSQQDGKSGVQKYRVKLLAESFGQSTMDVLCQIGLDGIRMLDPATSRTLRIYPLDTITRCEAIDSSTFAFWSKSSVDIEPRRIRLQSNSYTTNTILDTVTAATVQFKEMGGRSRPSESPKVTEQQNDKKKGFTDWLNVIKPVNEEKDHWVPDEVVNKCTSCGTDFNAFVRKHHCRNCGDIFCDKCTQGRTALTAEENAPVVRVCDRCLAEVSHRLTAAKDTASRSTVVQSHEDLAKKLQEELERSCKVSSGSKSDSSGRRMKEVACPTCTVHLQVQVPSSGSETIECGVCQHPFLVSAH